MSDTNTGGPAFPQDYEHTKVLVQMQRVGDISVKDFQKLSKQLAGMTLRDYFAAHAPITYQDAIGWLDCYGGEVVGPWHPDKIMETLVDLRSDYADAMLKAREA